MSSVVAWITTSLDGYVPGPDDGPGRGLGRGGERLHYWVFGGPWRYGEQASGEVGDVDREVMEEIYSSWGAVLAGRGTYDAAEGWGGTNPWPIPLVVVTHRPGEQPPSGSGMVFVDGFDAALDRARAAAGGSSVGVMGGASTIRQALEGDHVDELVVSVAPVVLGAGKRLFDGFDRGLELEQVGVRQSPWVTHLRYRVSRSSPPAGR